MTDKLNELRDKIKNSKSFCFYPFLQLSTMTKGQGLPCCVFDAADPLVNKHNLSTETLEEIWMSDEFASIRKDMLEGKLVSGCKRCYEEEYSGKTSMRYRSHKEYLGRDDVLESVISTEINNFKPINTPTYLELKPSNLCNLKCRMCNAYDSSQIQDELKEIANEFPNCTKNLSGRFFEDKLWAKADHMKATTDKRPESNWMHFDNWSEDPKLWTSLQNMIPTLEVLSFAGGETTLLPIIPKILEYCVETGHAEHIIIFISSNFTNLNKSFLELMPFFKRFELIASIDGYKELNEYIRYPSKWKQIEKNFVAAKQYINGTSVKIITNITVQMNNILHLIDLLDWIEKIDEEPPHFWQEPYCLNFLHHPIYMQINALPVAGRQIAQRRLQDYMLRSKYIDQQPGTKERLLFLCEYLSRPFDESDLGKLASFWEYTNVLDKYRKQRLEDYDPELYCIIRDELVARKII